jgi:hypothetical protein
MTDFLRPPENQIEEKRFLQELCRVVNKRKPAIPADSTAANIGELVADFNALLAELRKVF